MRGITRLRALALCALLALTQLCCAPARADMLSGLLERLQGGLSDARDDEELPVFDSMDALVAHLTARTAALDTSIRFKYEGEALNRVFRSEDLAYDLLSNIAGIYNYSYVVWEDEDYNEYRYDSIVYPVGFRLARSYLNGDTSALSADELRALEKALAIASEARNLYSSEYEREMYIHDAICSLTEYELGANASELDYHDTAEGVLLWGRAECDGYADAFYLICTLAGLEAGYQTGEAFDPQRGISAGHQWNRIKLNGQWLFVDVTWDDMTSGGHSNVNSYTYANVGANCLPDHTWRDAAVPVQLAPEMDWSVFPYTSGQLNSTGYAAYYTDMKQALQNVYAEFAAGRESVVHCMVGGTYDEADFGAAFDEAFARVDRDVSINYWLYHWYSNTCFDIVFVNE